MPLVIKSMCAFSGTKPEQKSHVEHLGSHGMVFFYARETLSLWEIYFTLSLLCLLSSGQSGFSVTRQVVSFTFFLSLLLWQCC